MQSKAQTSSSITAAATSTRTRPLDLPEIVGRIVWYLDSADVFACSVVSRSFYKSFAYFAWQDLHIGRPSFGRPCKACSARDLSLYKELKSNAWKRIQQFGNSGEQGDDVAQIALSQVLRGKTLWVRSITIHQLNPLFPLALLCKEPTQLKSISLDYHVYGLPMPEDVEGYCIQLFQRNLTHLKSITLFKWINKELIGGRWLWSPLATCVEASNLKSLRLEKCTIREQNSYIFWKICERLEHLNLEAVDIDQSLPPQLENGNESTLPQTPVVRFPRMKDLLLHKYLRASALHVLHEIICHCPALRSLSWDMYSSEYSIQNVFCDLYAFSTWPNLDSITIDNFLHDDHHFKLLQSSKKPFRRLKFFPSGVQPKTFELLRQRHASTIQTVDLLTCDKDTSAWTIEILITCPSLEVIRANALRCKDILESGPWVCRKLQEFLIVIDMEFPDGQNRRFTAEEIQQCKEVYNRLSVLGQLRILDGFQSFSSTCDVNIARRRMLVPLPFRLEAGLGQLAGLNKMKLAAIVCIKQLMYMKEMEWIVQHWKRLRDLSGLWIIVGGEKIEGQEKYICNGTLYTWLHDRRISTAGCCFEHYLYPSNDEVVEYIDCCGTDSSRYAT